MRINPLQIFNNNKVDNKRYSYATDTISASRIKGSLQTDTLQFGARIDERFPKTFLKNLLKYKLPDPVTGETMYSLEVLNGSARRSLRIFEANKEEMTPINREVFEQISACAQKYPKKNLQQLLETMRPEARKSLEKIQRRIIEELRRFSYKIPQHKQQEFSDLLDETIKLIHSHELSKNKKFKRKVIIAKVDDFALGLKNDKDRVEIMNIIRTLPTSSNNVNSFIVKYANRNSEEIGMTLYRDRFATLEHLTPESQGGRIVVWESSENNSAKGDKPLTTQLAEHPEMRENAQAHINKLIFIHNNIYEQYPIDEQNRLKEYIFALKNEFAIASKEQLELDISGLGDIPQYMVENELFRINELNKTNYLKTLYKMLHS